VQSEITVPLLRDEHVLGVLNVESSVQLGPYDMDLLNTLAGPVAIAIENARLHTELKRMAWTDALSGLSNRRAFDTMLESEIARAQRYDHPLSLIIMDLDSFKEYNDRWGHLAGDERLKQLAAMLRQAVREPDITARYGGEEFAVILPNTSKEGALAMAERLRLCAEAQSPGVNRRQGPISGYTISVGVASYPQDAVNGLELLLAADNAELTAKRMGKNRVFTR
jgi:diguanylate cyclase (GGDEF)-like protein